MVVGSPPSEGGAGHGSRSLRGRATLDAVEEVCGADLETLASLLDKSLLRRDEDRYWMLETIREYGLEQLAIRPA